MAKLSPYPLILLILRRSSIWRAPCWNRQQSERARAVRAGSWETSFIRGRRGRGEQLNCDGQAHHRAVVALDLAARVERGALLGLERARHAHLAAAEALGYTDAPATVVLVSDGIETCHPDPCAAARALVDIWRRLEYHLSPEALAKG